MIRGEDFQFKERVLAHHGADHGSLAWACIEIDEYHLLVFGGEELSVGEGCGHRWADEGGAEVAVAVVVVPGGFMLIAGVVGDEFLHHRFEIVVDEAGLELDRGQGAGAADGEKMEEAFADRLPDVMRELGMKINDVGVAVGGNLQGEALHCVDTEGEMNRVHSAECTGG